MGSGAYSTMDRSIRATSLGYDKEPEKAFKSKSINNAMSPHGITVREAFDNEEHPNSLAIILALDVTGSMGSVPHFLVKEGLPHVMDSIIQGGIPDPQLLFLGIGDHECDTSPLQVGQFESSDELLDKWLTDIYLEGGGGSNGGESYLLAWYFAAMHTDIDCYKKRNQKGFLFTVGDEPVLRRITTRQLQNLMGPGQYQDFTAAELVEKAMQKYHVYHIHIRETASGSRQHVIDEWKQLLHDNLIVADGKTDVANIIASIVTAGKVNAEDLDAVGAEKKEQAEEIL